MTHLPPSLRLQKEDFNMRGPIWTMVSKTNHVLVNHPLMNIFKNFLMFIFERKGEAERDRETQNPKQAPDSELSAQSPMQGLNS